MGTRCPLATCHHHHHQENAMARETLSVAPARATGLSFLLFGRQAHPVCRLERYGRMLQTATP